MMYCENCFQENLIDWVEDDLGFVFCSEKCFKESQEWRRINVNKLQLTEVKL